MEPPSSIRVAVRSSHPVIEAGLRTLLHSHPGIEVVEANSADVVVIDGPEDGPEGVAMVRLVAADQPGPLPMPEGPGGAILSRDVSEEALVAAIHAAAAGLLVTDPEVHVADAPRPAGDLDLTPREMEVLRLLADGLPNKGIAYALGISDHTAKFHVGQILSKLDAGSRTEAVTVAIRRGMLPL
jgi:DNA-binding NarL/FixJ family response regulator